MNRFYDEARDVEEFNEVLTTLKVRKDSSVKHSLATYKLGKYQNKLISLCHDIEYLNVGFHQRQDVAELFEVELSSLNKLLNKFVKLGLIKYSGNLSRSNILRILWNPSIVWRGDETLKCLAISRWDGVVAPDVSEAASIKESGIYLLKCNQFLKIGCSKDINKRFYNIQTSNPYKVELVAKYNCPTDTMRDLEKYLHYTYRDKLHMLEWFRDEFSVEDFLSACEDYINKQ